MFRMILFSWFSSFQVIQPILKQQFIHGSAELMMIGPSPEPPAADASPSSITAQGNLIHIIGQVFVVQDPNFIIKMSELLRVCCLKLLVLFTEHAESYFPAPSGEKSLMVCFSILASTLLLKRDREHIQIDVGTVFQAQNLLAQISVRGQVLPR